MFDGHELRAVCAAQLEKATREAQGVDDGAFASRSTDEIVDSIVKHYDLETPELAWKRKELTDEGPDGGVMLHVPFAGRSEIFAFRPNLRVGSGWPDGRVVGSELVAELGRADAGIEVRADRWETKVRQYLAAAAANDLDTWRSQLRDRIRMEVTMRAEHIESHKAALSQVSIPIRPRTDAPAVFREPVIMRRPSPMQTSPHTRPDEHDEASLSDAYYEHILFVIRAAGKAMERSPATYARWGEEDRRQVLILMLNTHYEGKAVAEAFNGDGDTDILIREEDKNVFIGECKFHAGSQSVIDTVDQLFGYATWRDVKLAIIFFRDSSSSGGELDPFRAKCRAGSAGPWPGAAPEHTPLRRHAKALRQILFCVPARITRSARQTILHLPHGFRHLHIFQATYDAAYALGAP